MTRNTARTPLALNAVHDILPSKFERACERVTRTTGTYDLSKVKNEEDLLRAFELMERVRNIKRNRKDPDSEEDDDDESEQTHPDINKKPRRQGKRKRSNDQDAVGVNAMSVLEECRQMHSDVIAAMNGSSTNSGCRYCGGDHLVRSCPDLRPRRKL